MTANLLSHDSTGESFRQPSGNGRIETPITASDVALERAIMIFCMAILLSIYVLLQRALYRLEQYAQKAGVALPGTTDLSDPLSAILPTRSYPRTEASKTLPARAEEQETADEEPDDDLRKHILKGVLHSPLPLPGAGELKNRHISRLHKARPATLSPLRTTFKADSLTPPGTCSPLGSPLGLLKSPLRMHSPRSPRSPFGSRGVRSPVMMDVEEGFRAVFSPSSPFPKRGNEIKPGSSPSRLVPVRNGLLKSPRKPKFSPRQAKFEVSGPKKAAFDDEGFAGDADIGTAPLAGLGSYQHSQELTGLRQRH